LPAQPVDATLIKLLTGQRFPKVGTKKPVRSSDVNSHSPWYKNSVPSQMSTGHIVSSRPQVLRVLHVFRQITLMLRRGQFGGLVVVNE